MWNTELANETTLMASSDRRIVVPRRFVYRIVDIPGELEEGILRYCQSARLHTSRRGRRLDDIVLSTTFLQLE